MSEKQVLSVFSQMQTEKSEHQISASRDQQ